MSAIFLEVSKLALKVELILCYFFLPYLLVLLRLRRDRRLLRLFLVILLLVNLRRRSTIFRHICFAKIVTSFDHTFEFIIDVHSIDLSICPKTNDLKHMITNECILFLLATRERYDGHLFDPDGKSTKHI